MATTSSNESITKEVKLKIKSARKQIGAGEFVKAIDTCKEILKLENSYMAHVFMAASYVGVDNTSAALKHFKMAIEMDQTQLLAYEGLGKLFEKKSKDLSKEVEFCKEIFHKMMTFLKDDEAKRQQVSLQYLEIFKDIKDPKGVYLVTSSLLIASNFEELKDDIKHGVSVQHIRAVDDVDMRFELKSDNQQLKDLCDYVMKHQLSDEDTVEVAWRHYFIISNKSSDLKTLWTLATEKCPRPFCHFNAERVLLMFMETYPGHKVAEMKAYEQALPPDNNVLQLLSAVCMQDQAEAVKVMTEVLAKDKYLIVAYVQLALSQCNIMHFENAITTAETGISLLEHTEAVYHQEQSAMLNQLHLTLLHTTHHHAKELKLKMEATEWCSGNKITFLQSLCALHHMHALEEIETEIETSLSLIEEDHEEGADNGVKRDEVHREVFYVYAAKAVLLRHKEDHKAEEFFDKAIESGDISDHLIYYHKALFHWKQLQSTAKEDNEGIKDKFTESIIKTIQLQKLDAMPFYYLGLYFTEVSNPFIAKDYLMKAYELDKSRREEIMLDLVDCLIRLGDQDLTFTYLCDILKKMGTKCSKWVHLRLGAYHLKHHDHLQAITHLQQALRTDINNYHSWERLGEAYMHRGSYLSAMKAFDKALNIHESLYSLYQKAIIQQKLGELESALETFNRVILTTPNYLPALYGLSLTHLERAKVLVRECLLKRALCHLQEAITHASKGCEVNAGFSCLWKCLADCFSSFYHFGEDNILLSIPEYMESKFSIKHSSTHCKLDLLKLGEKCYMLALKIKQSPSSPPPPPSSPSSPSSSPSSSSPPSPSSLWHDLSLNNLYQAKHTLLLSHTTNKEAFAKLSLKRAFQACRRAIELSPGNFLHWNLLGVVAATRPMEDSSIAQHCFIKSIQLQNHNEVAWSNLGFVYLSSNKMELAHQAFSMAQSVDPSFANSWIGQALIADNCKDSRGVGSFEAMDLFRHSVEICNHPEAALAYAYWVCHTMQEHDNNAPNDNTHKITQTNINNSNLNNKTNKDDNANKDDVDTNIWLRYSFEHLSPLFSASDALLKYLELRPSCHVGWNLYGLLNLKQQLHHTSCHAFQRALEVADRDEGHKAKKDMVLLRGNYAKSLLKTEQYDKAIDIYTHMPQLTFSSECLMALCHYKLGHYEQATETYYNARDKSSDSRLLELTSVALAAACYCINDLPSAKEFLFENIGKDHIATKETLISLLCFGILTKEVELLRAVVMEVEKVDRQCYHSLLVPLCLNLAFPLAVAEYYLKKFPFGIEANRKTGNNDFKLKYSSIHHLATAIRLFPNQSKPLSRLAVFFLAGVSIDDDLTTCDSVIGGVCRSAINNDDMLHFQEALQCFIISHLNNKSLTNDNNINNNKIYNKIYSKSDSNTIDKKSQIDNKIENINKNENPIDATKSDDSDDNKVNKCYLNNNNKNKNKASSIFYEAQKLVMLYPDRLENWCLLLASCQHRIAQRIQHIENLNQACHDDLDYLTSFIDRISKDLIDKVEKKLMVNRDDPYLRCMHQWLSRQRVVAMLMRQKDKVDVLTFLQNAIWLYEDDASLECLKRFVNSLDNEEDSNSIMEEIKKINEFNTDKNKNSLNYVKMYLLLLLKKGKCNEEVLRNMKGIKLFTKNIVLREFVEHCL